MLLYGSEYLAKISWLILFSFCSESELGDTSRLDFCLNYCHKQDTKLVFFKMNYSRYSLFPTCELYLIDCETYNVWVGLDYMA